MTKRIIKTHTKKEAEKIMDKLSSFYTDRIYKIVAWKNRYHVGEVINGELFCVPVVFASLEMAGRLG